MSNIKNAFYIILLIVGIGLVFQVVSPYLSGKATSNTNTSNTNLCKFEVINRTSWPSGFQNYIGDYYPYVKSILPSDLIRQGYYYSKLSGDCSMNLCYKSIADPNLAGGCAPGIGWPAGFSAYIGDVVACGPICGKGPAYVYMSLNKPYSITYKNYCDYSEMEIGRAVACGIDCNNGPKKVCVRLL